MSSCVCKISFKSVQVCGGCCEMFRGLTFLGHSVEARGFTSSRKIGVGNGFPVLCDEIASVYLFEKYIYMLALEMASPGNRHCANCIGTLSFPVADPNPYPQSQ